MDIKLKDLINQDFKKIFYIFESEAIDNAAQRLNLTDGDLPHALETVYYAENSEGLIVVRRDEEFRCNMTVVSDESDDPITDCTLQNALKLKIRD